MTVEGFGKEVVKLVKHREELVELIKRMEGHFVAADQGQDYTIAVQTGYTAHAHISFRALNDFAISRIHKTIVKELEDELIVVEERLEALMKGGYK